MAWSEPVRYRLFHRIAAQILENRGLPYCCPYTVEIEVALKSHLTKLGYVAGRNLTYLPTVPPVEPTAYLIKLNLGKARELGITFDAKTIGPAARVIP